jgi:hypothetical protein
MHPRVAASTSVPEDNLGSWSTGLTVSGSDPDPSVVGTSGSSVTDVSSGGSDVVTVGVVSSATVEVTADSESVDRSLIAAVLGVSSSNALSAPVCGESVANRRIINIAAARRTAARRDPKKPRIQNDPPRGTWGNPLVSSCKALDADFEERNCEVLSESANCACNSRGAGMTGKEASSASGLAARARVLSQISQSSMCRASRFRRRGESVPSQLPRTASSSSQSRRPRRATKRAVKLRSTRSLTLPTRT